MGAVNIFLGGTGKGVAEDIQDSRDFYPGYREAISEPIAFDLNAAIRPGVRLGLVTPDGDTSGAVADLAAEWTTLDPGSGVGPAAAHTALGPQRTPERSLLVKIGEGIARDPEPRAGLFALRAHGLAVFSMLFDEGHQMAGTGSGNRLRGRIRSLVLQQTFGDQPPRINLVTSTAGGTGAGTVIPLALWLREQYPHSDLNLVAVTASAFTNELQGNSLLDELAAKGRSGTFAMMRELSYLSLTADPQTRFSPRHLPVTRRGLGYRPRQPLFDSVCWFGGRQARRKQDAFEEAGVLLRLLSNDDSANDLAAEMGVSPMQWVGAVTAIEYPKLRYQRQLISHVLQDAYSALREQAALPPGAAADNTTLLDYVSGATRTLGGWFHGQRHGPLALPAGSPVDADAADELAGRLRDLAGTGSGYAAVSRGTDMQGPTYNSNTPEWQAYTGQVKGGLDREAGSRQRRMLDAIGGARREEEQEFGTWIAREVLQRRLGGDGDRPTPTGDVLALLDRLDSHAETLHGLIDQDLFPTEKTIDQCDEEIRTATDHFDTPPSRGAGPSVGDRVIAWSIGAFALLVVLGAARLIGDFMLGSVESEWLAWISAVAAMFAAYRFARWALLRGKVEEASLSARRKSAEDRLFAAYEERDRVRALRWLHEELRGSNGGRSFFRELRQQIAAARAAVAVLDEVYEGLEHKATAAVTQAATSAPHVAAEVGDRIMADLDIAQNIRRQLQERLRVEAPLDPGPRVRGLRLRLVHADEGDEEPFTPALAEADMILRAIRAAAGPSLVDAQKVENLWSETAWNLINWKLGENLPEHFSAALAYRDGDTGGATRTLATKLQGLSLPRRPSVDLRADASEPAHRRVYVGSAAILGEFNRALAEPALGAQASVLGAYNDPQVVPALGEQIVFLDLWGDPGDQPWAPGVIGSAPEVMKAMETYYGGEPGVPDVATAKETCFTVLPELLAATKIELGGMVEPLAPPVVARLLGSDLDTQGPTYAELFYLLRHRGWLVTRVEDDGPDARRVMVLGEGPDDARPLRLAAWPRGGLDDTVFGAGRTEIVAFDAFSEFMRFDGTPLIAGVAQDGHSFPRTDLFLADWAGGPERVAAFQRAVVREWHHGEVEADCAAMIVLLEEDLVRMDSGDGYTRSSWERAMRRLLAGDERRKIRNTHLDGPSPQGSGG